MSMNPKEIEIYPNIMLVRFIEKGLINTEKENSKYIIVSSYIKRLEQMQVLIPERRRLMLF